MADDGNQKSFWTFWASLPGIITATAGLIAAVGGVIGGLAAAGIIGGSSLSASPTPITEPAPLELRLAFLKRHADGTVSELQDGDELTSEDHYGFFFEPAQETYVYVLQQDATGDTFVLFPNRELTPQVNPVPEGMEVWVPRDRDHWFSLDENIGREVIMVVATKERNQELESTLDSLGAEGDARKFAEWRKSNERGPGDVEKFETQTVLFPDGRKLPLDTLRVQGQGEEDFVYEIEFEHK